VFCHQRKPVIVIKAGTARVTLYNSISERVDFCTKRCVLAFPFCAGYTVERADSVIVDNCHITKRISDAEIVERSNAKQWLITKYRFRKLCNRVVRIYKRTCPRSTGIECSIHTVNCTQCCYTVVRKTACHYIRSACSFTAAGFLAAFVDGHHEVKRLSAHAMKQLIPRAIAALPDAIEFVVVKHRKNGNWHILHPRRSLRPLRVVLCLSCCPISKNYRGLCRAVHHNHTLRT